MRDPQKSQRTVRLYRTCVRGGANGASRLPAFYARAIDPNWFYSTLAQSTAAIVGLIGGFLVARLLAQREEIAGLRERLRNRCKELLVRLTEERNRAARVADSMHGIEQLLLEAEQAGLGAAPIPNPQPVELLVPLQYGGYSTAGLAFDLGTANRPVVNEVGRIAGEYRDSLPAEFEPLVEMLRTEGELRPSEDASWLREESVGLPAPDPAQQDQFFTWLAAQQDIARSRWAALRLEADGAVDHLRNFRARLVPQSLYWLLGILSALLGAGLIAPLFFLSSRGDASRPALLGGFTVLAAALLGYFAYELWRLRRADRLASDTF